MLQAPVRCCVIWQASKPCVACGRGSSGTQAALLPVHVPAWYASCGAQSRRECRSAQLKIRPVVTGGMRGNDMADSATTIDPAEIERFARMADEWWDPTGKFRPLHRFNPVRLAYIRDQITQRFGRDPHVA